MEYVFNIPYYILAIPVFLIFLGFVVNLILSPFIVIHNLFEAFNPKKRSTSLYPLVNKLFRGSTGSPPTAKEFKMFSKLSKKELIEISKTTKNYDPRYKIDDPLQFGD